MIEIRKSPTADTRTCDWSKVTKETLKYSSIVHIEDIREGLDFFADKLVNAGTIHDHDKLSELDHFHADFKTGFEQTGWWDNHRKVNRHHLDHPDSVPEDVDMIDVIEHITDCVMACKARGGEYRPINLPPEVLQRAVANTEAKLLAEVVVIDE